MIDIKNLFRLIATKPVSYWLGATGTVDYDIVVDHLILKTSFGDKRNLCLVREIEYWSENSSMKIVTLGLKSGNRIVVKDTAGKLVLLLSKNPMLAQRRD
ncbi:MAG: hypothetical protein ABSE90_03175 [Verrucomicrobiota bacterium]|jgi:hypothetical protein